MSNTFKENLRPFIEAELLSASRAKADSDSITEFAHLENAHIIGQESTYWHVKIHYLMLLWGVRNGSVKEISGQLFRIVGATTKTAIGLVPQGNTGGANISPFKVLPLKPQHAEIIRNARAGIQ